MTNRHYKSAKNRRKRRRMIAKNEEILRRLKQEKSISILLGAGFSAPMGYPIGNQLTQRILFYAKCDNCFAFSSAGELYVSKDGTKPNPENKNSYDWYFDFCKDAIRYYKDNIKTFDYEEFYDYLKEKAKAKDDIGLKERFEKGDYPKSDFDIFENYLYQIDKIYVQIIGFLLKGKDGKSWYDDEPTHLKPTFNDYTGFLNCIEKLAENHIINVHTLNHDLFFERLNRIEWINDELCDGFEELGSPFYGELLHYNRTYKCRLSRYTGKYRKNIRLYKLHGSKDYYVYYTNKGKGSTLYPETYIKTRWGIGNTDFYKKIKKGKSVEYENCSVNYHPDFLTGTTSKIARYKEPLLYKKLFELFKKNLNRAEMLIIIGYGCKDSEINKYIIEQFGKNKPCFVIDPFADKTVKDFIKELGSNTTLVSEQLNDLSIADIGLSH
jgi:hypothetical protein